MQHQQFFEDLVTAVKVQYPRKIDIYICTYLWFQKSEHSFGVYTSNHNWRQIMGCDYHGGANLPLW